MQRGLLGRSACQTRLDALELELRLALGMSDQSPCLQRQ